MLAQLRPAAELCEVRSYRKDFDICVGSRTWQNMGMKITRSSILAEAAALTAISLSAGTGTKGVQASLRRIARAATEDLRAAIVQATSDAMVFDREDIVVMASRLERMTLEQCLSTAATSSMAADRIKAGGVIHTPAPLADFIVANAFKRWCRQNQNLRAPAMVGDLSSGAGAFLSALSKLPLPSETRVIGMEKDFVSIVCSELLRIANRKNWELVHCDSLFAGAKQQNLLDRQSSLSEFDLLVGNPPYVRSASLPPSYVSKLRNEFETIGPGNFDLSIAFLEQALDKLKPNGLFSYVTSSKFTSAKYGRLIADRLSHDNRVLSIDDFSDAQIFPGVTTYVLIVTVSKAKPTKRFTFTSYDGFDLQRDRLTSRKSTALPVIGTLDFPWVFATGGVKEALKCVTESTLPLLTDIFPSIFQGVRTGANDVYVVDRSTDLELEAAVLLPFVSGREISRQALAVGEKQLIFPYRLNSFRQIEPVPPRVLERSFPNAASHLRKHEALLRERSSDEDLPWYCFSRSQNLDAFLKPKIFVKEMMARAEFACDTAGEIAFCSGYALDASGHSESSVVAWTAILNTPTMEFALRHVGTQLHSGWFRMLKHQLKRLRLPRISSIDWESVLRLSALLQANPSSESAAKAANLLDDIVASAFGLTSAHRDSISGYLAAAHAKSCAGESSRELGASVESTYEPVKLDRFNPLHRERFELHHLVTFKGAKLQPIHRWYPYTQGFDPNLVHTLLSDFGLPPGATVLDPFGGVGTTGLACRSAGFNSVLNDISPLMTWVSRTKNVAFSISGVQKALASLDLGQVAAERPMDINPSLFRNFFDTAYSPNILRGVLSLLAFIDSRVEDEKISAFLKLMLLGKLESLSNIRKHGSHYRYLNSATSVGLEKLNIPIADPNTDVVEVWLDAVRTGLADIATMQFALPASAMRILLGDARKLRIPDSSIDAVITSPPYLNRNNYIAQQKGELALLNFVSDSEAYKTLVRSTLASHVEATLPTTPRSSTREVNELIEKISLTEGNNPKIPCMIAGYFEDTAAVLSELARVCKPGAKVAFVVGNARWGGVVIPVDHLVMLLAEQAGFRPERIVITRYKGNSPQQMRRFGRIAVRESIVVFSKTN